MILGDGGTWGRGDGVMGRLGGLGDEETGSNKWYLHFRRSVLVLFLTTLPTPSSQLPLPASPKYFEAV